MAHHNLLPLLKLLVKCSDFILSSFLRRCALREDHFLKRQMFQLLVCWVIETIIFLTELADRQVLTAIIRRINQ